MYFNGRDQNTLEEVVGKFLLVLNLCLPSLIQPKCGSGNAAAIARIVSPRVGGGVLHPRYIIRSVPGSQLRYLTATG